MRHAIDVRGSIALLAVGLATSWSIPAAMAACGMAAVNGGASGPPSISTTETSTTQVLEQIRRRTQEAQSPQTIPVSNEAAPAQEQTAAPVEPAPVADAAPKPAPKPAPVSEAASAPAPKPAKKAPVAESAPEPEVVEPSPKAKAAKPTKTADAEQAVEPEPELKAALKAKSSRAYTPSLKDYAVAEETSYVGGISRTTAVWAQGYLGYDRHKNIAPGNQENPTRRAVSGGGLIGADWTHVNRGENVNAFQFGVFSGYNETRAKLSKTFFAVNETGAPPDTLPGGGNTNYFREDNKETIDGPFVGTYMAYVKDQWTFDVAFKADFFDLTQSSTLRQRCDDDVGTQNGSASVNNYMISANAAHRYLIGDDNKWWEPTVGVRYTITEFGSDPSNSVFRDGGVQPTGRLGLEDGSALRLQVGARFGDRVELEGGYVLSTTVGTYLYSDVAISGFESVAGQTGEAVGPVDEGKLRVLGQLETRLSLGNGLSYMMQAEIRGGGDVLGAAGQLGMRYEW